MFVPEVVQLRKIVNNCLRRLCNACRPIQTNLLQPSAIAALAVASKSVVRLDHAPNEGMFGMTSRLT
jgi:hypothetical protein